MGTHIVERRLTQPGLAGAFKTGLADAVAYAKQPHEAPPKTGAIYGSMPKDVPQIEEAVRAAMLEMMDAQQTVLTE